MSTAPLLSATALTRYHHGRKILHGVDLKLHRGEVLGLLGPNGAGKSTTMNILSGVIAPHSGTVFLNGFDIAREPLQAKRELGYLPELPPLHRDATVDEYLRYCAQLRGLNGDRLRSSLDRVKTQCDLVDVGARLIANLSKGFQQRVGIAQALLHEPAVVILDEPTSGLDPNQIRAVRETIRQIAENHAVILSTHILSEAETLCHRVVILHEGRIAFNESLAEDGEALLLQLAKPPATADLCALAPVRRVTELGFGRYRLDVDDYDLAAQLVCEVNANNDWGLREMSRDSSALEQVFVDLTCRDSGLEA